MTRVLRSLLLVVALAGCAGSGAPGEEPAETTAEAIVGTNPWFDGTVLFSAADGTYRDISVSADSIFLVRSSGSIEVRAIATPTQVSRTIPGAFRSADFLTDGGGTMGLTASSNATREIWLHAERTTPDAKIAYPPDVTSTTGLATMVDSMGQLVVWVGGIPVPPVSHGFRKLTFNPTTRRATWDPTTYCSLFYQQAVAARDRLLLTYLDFTSHAFERITPAPTCAVVNEAISPHTEHAYTDPTRGLGDRINPIDFDYSPSTDQYFALDPYVESGGFRQQTIVTLPAPHVMLPCTVAAQCPTGQACSNGLCRLPLGAACDSASECATGFCAQGVCCSTACTATCMSCALVGTAGTCTPVPAGNDPLNQCVNQSPATCGTDGACNGAGACRLYASGTTCAGMTCTGSTFTPARTCNGAGVCQTASSTSCAPYTCGTNNACRTSCTIAEDCTTGASCTGGVCR
jgi:hypothetical protein